VATIAAPDGALLRCVLVNLFSDRQIAVDEVLISYLMVQIERSFAAARRPGAGQRPLGRGMIWGAGAAGGHAFGLFSMLTGWRIMFLRHPVT
jgi:hypothetical protein